MFAKMLYTLDNVGNGDDCSACGWRQSEESFDHPNIAGIRNIPSLNNARKQHQEGKSAILANFNDFIETYHSYGEVQFTYCNTIYAVIFDDEAKCIMLYNTKNQNQQDHKTIEEFIKNANIDGKLLKDIWNEVENTDFLQ